jgi:16S rRNA (guanine966-N2)-methyltransferase
LRIIAGKYGGRRLAHFKADHIRPTTDRVKESLFNKLQSLITGARVLDLFSGTGNLAFESLSRGALSVDAVEKSKTSISIIKKNKELLGVGQELRIIPKDVIQFLSQCQTPYDIILIDPPFTEKMADQVLKALAASGAYGEHSEVFIESSSQEQVKDSYPPMQRKSHRAYGDKFLSHYVFS